MRIRTGLCVAAIGLLAGAAHAQSVDETLNSKTMFGINRSNGSLVRYDFAAQQLTSIGTIRNTANNQAMLGIDAAVMFPGFTNIYALWQDPGDGNKNKLVFVDANTAGGTVVFGDLEGGKFGGATHFATATNPYTVFAVQHAKIKPPSTISGLANINPNNSSDNEFACVRGDGTTFTRDHLHQDSPVSGNGTYYEGPATMLHLKPKGNGNQNGLIINGEAFSLKNSNTYTFSGQMQVRVYNDKIQGNGKAMGKWWVQVISGEVIINNDVQILSPHRLTSVDQTNGEVTEIMRLSRAYNSLATSNGTTFYATSGASLYVIDTVALTETKIATTAVGNGSGLEFAGSYMMVYDLNNSTLAPMNHASGALLASPANLGMGHLGTFMFNPVNLDPALKVAQFD